MAAPSAPVLGTPNQGTTGATTYTLPSHQANDCLFLAAENNLTAGLTNPAGAWADIDGSPRAQGSNVVALTAWWLRATGGSTTNPQVPATSDHQVGIPIMVRGCLTSGDPWTASSSDGQATGTTGRAFDSAAGGNSIVTVDADCLVLYFIACSADIGTDNASNFNTPTGLTGFTVLDQHNTTGGNGGSVIVAYGYKATAGAVGPLTWDFGTTSAWSGIALALPGASASQDESSGSTATVTTTAAGAGTAAEAVSAGSTASVATTASGSGTATESVSGGSTASETTTATGAGTAAEAVTSGSTATVTAPASGAGTATEHAEGGSTASVSIVAVGAGSNSESEDHSGGSSATVSVSVAAAGSALETAEGGFPSFVGVVAGGDGIGLEYAESGSASLVTVIAIGEGAEQIVRTVAPRARWIVVPAEDRSVHVLREDRSIDVAAEDRSITPA